MTVHAKKMLLFFSLYAISMSTRPLAASAKGRRKLPGRCLGLRNVSIVLLILREGTGGGKLAVYRISYIIQEIQVYKVVEMPTTHTASTCSLLVACTCTACERGTTKKYKINPRICLVRNVHY